MTLPYSRINSIYSSEGVAELNPNGTLMKDGLPYGVSAMNVQQLWSEGYTGKGVWCAIVDSGIDDTHPDLKGKVKMRYSRVSGPLHPHGTHISGTVAGSSLVKGVAPDAGLVDVRIYDKTGSGVDSTIALGLNWIASQVQAGNPIRVVNLSLGGNRSDTNMRNALKRLSDLGVTITVSSGNNGDGNPMTEEKSFPADLPFVISVGSYDPRTGKVSDFSNSGPYLDCVASGVEVLSTVPESMYAVYDGTSMSSAHVAGMVCLLYQKVQHDRPDLKGVDLAAEVKDRLLHSYCQGGKGVGIDTEMGCGVIRYNENKTTLSIIEDMKTNQIKTVKTV